MLMFRRPPVSSWKKFAFSCSSLDESSVHPSAASIPYDAQSMPVILARVTRIGRTAGSLELLGLASRGVKVHGLTILGGGVSVYELDGDGPVVRRLGRPEIHVLNGLARTDIWPLERSMSS